MRKSALVAFCLAVVLFCSCSLEKRLYNTGFYVDRSKQRDAPGIKSNGEPGMDAALSINIPPKAPDNNSTPGFKTLTEAISPPLTGRGDRVKKNRRPSKRLQTPAGTKQEKKHAAKPKLFHKKTMPAGGSGKSQLVALLLCLFFGLLGVHRFYLGYVGIGLIQLFTVGGFGIWTLIDLIMIITGSLKPKNGEYSEKF
jgi:TM2 domain-containing membrane protein YozV